MPAHNTFQLNEQIGQQSLDELAGLFFNSPDDLGSFTSVVPGDLPNAYEALLAHSSHMTVTAEKFHDCNVNVRVLGEQRDGSHYARKILLNRQSDGTAIQFGIMRVDLSLLTSEVQAEIESGKTPLGRVLVDHDVMRNVELITLWRVMPKIPITTYLPCEPNQPVFGRTARILVDGKPAIELLEIVVADK